MAANGTYSSVRIYQSKMHLYHLILQVNFQFIFAHHASRVITNHASEKSNQPLFLYLAFQDTHGPLQVDLILYI